MVTTTGARAGGATKLVAWTTSTGPDQCSMVGQLACRQSQCAARAGTGEVAARTPAGRTSGSVVRPLRETAYPCTTTSSRGASESSNLAVVCPTPVRSEITGLASMAMRNGAPRLDAPRSVVTPGGAYRFTNAPDSGPGTDRSTENRMDNRRHATVRLRLASVVVVLLVSLAAILAISPASAAERPADWDMRIVPIVHEVEQIRGLSFDHPVEVEFLPDAAFAKRVSVDRGELSASDERQIERSEATLRAAGLVAGDVDLVTSLSDLQESGVLAYYEPRSETITVRGKALDSTTRVTLAHELTHALQDQHFDLERIQRRARRSNGSAAARALIEGDAKRVELAYLDTLSDDDRSAYTRSAAGSRIPGRRRPRRRRRADRAGRDVPEPLLARSGDAPGARRRSRRAGGRRALRRSARERRELSRPPHVAEGPHDP